MDTPHGVKYQNQNSEITMKMNFFHATIGVIIFTLLFLGNVMYAEENNAQGPLFPQPTSGFKQLTNQELWEDYLVLVQFRNKITEQELTQNEIDNLREEFIRSKQGVYDFFLKMLLWNNYREIANWDNLDMSGLKQLQWDAETDKKSYKIGEPIVLRLSLKNISQGEIQVLYPRLSYGFQLNSIDLKKITKDKKQRVNLTKDGYRHYMQVGFHGNPRPFNSFQLKPGEKAPTHATFGVLHSFYDVSEPGEYELTFYTRNYLGDDEHQIGEYPKPCTIRFKIEYPLYEPEIKWPDDETVIE